MLVIFSYSNYKYKIFNVLKSVHLIWHNPFLLLKLTLFGIFYAAPLLSGEVESRDIGIIFEQGKVLHIYDDKFSTTHYHLAFDGVFYYCFVYNDESNRGRAPVQCIDNLSN